MSAKKRKAFDTYKKKTSAVMDWFGKYGSGLDRLGGLDKVFGTNESFGRASSTAFTGTADVIQVGSGAIKASLKFSKLRRMSSAEREEWEKKHNLTYRQALWFNLVDLILKVPLAWLLLPSAIVGVASFLSAYFQVSGGVIAALTGSLMTGLASIAGSLAMVLMAGDSLLKAVQSRVKFNDSREKMYAYERILKFELLSKKIHANQIDAFVAASPSVKEKIKTYWVSCGISSESIKNFVDARNRNNQLRKKLTENILNTIVFGILTLVAIALITHPVALTMITLGAFTWKFGASKIVTLFFDWIAKKKDQRNHRYARVLPYKKFYEHGVGLADNSEKKYTFDDYNQKTKEFSSWVDEKNGVVSRILNVHDLLNRTMEIDQLSDQPNAKELTFLNGVGVSILRAFSAVTMALNLLMTATKGWLKLFKLSRMDQSERDEWNNKHKLTGNAMFWFKGINVVLMTTAFLLYLPAAISSVTSLLATQWGLTGGVISFFSGSLVSSVVSGLGAATILLLAADSLFKTFQSGMKLFNVTKEMQSAQNELVEAFKSHGVELKKLATFIAAKPSEKEAMKVDLLAAGINSGMIETFLEARADANKARTKLLTNAIGTLVHVLSFVAAVAMLSNPLALAGIGLFVFAWRVGLNKVVPTFLNWVFKKISQKLDRGDDLGNDQDPRHDNYNVTNSNADILASLGSQNTEHERQLVRDNEYCSEPGQSSFYRNEDRMKQPTEDVPVSIPYGMGRTYL